MHTVLPLSDDTNVLLHYLDALQVGMLPKEGKATEMVFRWQTICYRSAAALLLVSDGATETAIDAFATWHESAQTASELSTQVLVWGMGKRKSSWMMTQPAD